MVRIESADSPELIATARQLFMEYAESLGIDLCFQGFAAELAKLPGDYARPDGRLMLAFNGRDAIGCGALRPLDGVACEMKRLYIRPALRGKGVGAAMIDVLIGSAREIGYRRMRLDTLPSMVAAIAMYRALGFREIPPYRANPVPGALFFELELSA